MKSNAWNFVAGASNGAALVWLGGFDFNRRCPELTMALALSAACGFVAVIWMSKSGQ